MRYLKRLLYSFSILFILMVSLVSFLFTTTPGVYTTLKLINLFVPGKIQIQQVSGNLMNHFSFHHFVYDHHKVRVEITEGHINWHLKTLFHQNLSSILSAENLLVHIKNASHIDIKIPKVPFNFQVNKVTIHHIHIQYPSGDRYFNNLKSHASINNTHWIIDSLTTDVANWHVQAKAAGESQSPYTLSTTLQFTAPVAKLQAIQGNLTLAGDSSRFHWEGAFNGLLKGRLHGSLNHGDELQTEADWSSKTLNNSQGHIAITGTFLSDITIHADTHLADPIAADWKITTHMKAGATDIDSTLNLPQTDLKTMLTAKGRLLDAEHGKLVISVLPGSYQLPTTSPIHTLPFKGGDLILNLTPKELLATGTLTIDPQKIIHIALHLPAFHFNQMITKQQRVDGSLNLQVNTLDFLQGFSRTAENIHGQLQMNLTAKGSLAKPNVQGELLLTNGSLSIPKSGLTFTPIQAKLISHDNHWQAEGSITSANQALTLKGQGDFYPQVTGQLNLMGDDFLAVKTPDYTVYLSPQLTMTFNPTSFGVSGSILVPSAKLKPIAFSNTVSLPEDVVFVNQDNTAKNPLNINTDIQIKMGENVALDVKGLRGFLDGAVRIQQSPQSTLNASGQLTIREGKYQAYGQDLIVDQGELTFAGGLIDNPAIHLRAIRKFSKSDLANANQSLDFSAANIDTIDVGSKTTVGIEMTGHLNAHKIKLFSIPANLSQADILSMLLLGKPASQASKSGGQLLLTAISSMNLDTGTKGLQLLSQLKQTLGIDFNLQNNTRYNQATSPNADNTALVVGKSLSKRLYLSYNIGLLQTDSNVFTLKYLLNKFFSIQVTASDTGSGLDLLYTHSKD